MAWNVPFRMGLNTGLVVVGSIGDNLRMDYSAIGDTTNLAARLQQLASLERSWSVRAPVGWCRALSVWRHYRQSR